MKAIARVVLTIVVLPLFFFMSGASAQRQMECLGRGVVAINQGDGTWQLLVSDTTALLPGDPRFISLQAE